MSQYSIAVKDFRIIKQAKVEPEGITLIYGPNGNGKSTLGKALVSLLSNQHSEDNFRHGQSSYAIAVRSGVNRLVYTRNGDVATLKFNDEPERQKLGRAPMSQVEPRFPLKRYDYEDDSFFPNFSFQNAVPIFGDISIYSLFSSMFSSIARVSERVTACQSDCRALAKKRDGSLASSEMLKEKVSESSKALDELKSQYPDIDVEYPAAKLLVSAKQKIDEFMQEYVALSASCADPAKRAMAELYDEAQPLLPSVMLVEKINGVINQHDGLKNELERVRLEAGSLPDIPVSVDPYRLVSFGVKIQELEGRLVEARSEAVPDVSTALIDGVGRLRSFEHKAQAVTSDTPPEVPVSLFNGMAAMVAWGRELGVVIAQLESVQREELELRKQLQALPCERYAEGLCPFADKFVA
jgi:energy-coupling factor transporter ATP-binding protein EcfA2